MRGGLGRQRRTSAFLFGRRRRRRRLGNRGAGGRTRMASAVHLHHVSGNLAQIDFIDDRIVMSDVA